jgi:hypothetical protein
MSRATRLRVFLVIYAALGIVFLLAGAGPYP